MQSTCLEADPIRLSVVSINRQTTRNSEHDVPTKLFLIRISEVSTVPICTALDITVLPYTTNSIGPATLLHRQPRAHHARRKDRTHYMLEVLNNPGPSCRQWIHTSSTVPMHTTEQSRLGPDSIIHVGRRRNWMGQLHFHHLRYVCVAQINLEC